MLNERIAMIKKFKNESEKLNYEYIQQLKQKMVTDREPTVSTENGEACFIRILHRGEQLFYQQGEKALICEISTTHGRCYVDSIRKWDDGSKISDDEKTVIYKRISNWWLVMQKESIQFVGKAGNVVDIQC
jgi:hypothetical protein